MLRHRKALRHLERRPQPVRRARASPRPSSESRRGPENGILLEQEVEARRRACRPRSATRPVRPARGSSPSASGECGGSCRRRASREGARARRQRRDRRGARSRRTDRSRNPAMRSSETARIRALIGSVISVGTAGERAWMNVNPCPGAVRRYGAGQRHHHHLSAVTVRDQCARSMTRSMRLLRVTVRVLHDFSPGERADRRTHHDVARPVAIVIHARQADRRRAPYISGPTIHVDLGHQRVVSFVTAAAAANAVVE